jgi:CHAT domain-containing protein
MRACAGVKNAYRQRLRSLLQRLCIAWAMCLSACTGGFETEPLVEFSTDLVVGGTQPQTLVRQLSAGTYLLEVRERDIDLRVRVEDGTLQTELADACLRHGVHRTVVSLAAPARLRFTLDSIDQRGWKGAAAVRVLRWPNGAPDVPEDERLRGFRAQGEANALIARDNVQAWRAALAALNEAARHFQAANDLQGLAEAEYQRGWLERTLLFEFDASRRTAAAALAHFRAAGDPVGAQRAAVLLGLDEFSIASGLGPNVPHAERRALLENAARRVAGAQAFFEARDMQSDALAALGAAGRDNVAVFETLRSRARLRDDRYFEVVAAENLGALARRRGDVARAAALYEGVLSLIDRDRNPELYAALRSGLGAALSARGEFDRAMMLHSEALELFSVRGDHRRTAQQLIALASIQFRSGNFERALATLESALPLYQDSRDQEGQVSALRLAGNSAAALGRHDLAIDYLREAERRDRHGDGVDRTRVLIARELRHLGNLRGADVLLAQVLQSPEGVTRADALAERAQLRMRQQRHREALADLREADATYGALGLDFDRIDSSSELALALLDAGDLAGARAAADIAVALEQRIRVKAAVPEVRARFLSASYAPYEARIEVELAAAPGDRDASWRAFRTAETIRARSLADRLAQGTPRGATRRDSEIEQLRQLMSRLQDDLERHTRAAEGHGHELLETRRQIDETRARLEARLLRQNAVQASGEPDIAESRAAVQAALPEDTAVLAYFVGDRRSHAWLLTRRELRHAVLPGRRLLGEHVAALITRQRAHLAAVPDPVLAPSLDVLLNGVNARRLLILPDGPLNGLPFATLPMPRGGARELLIDRFVIASAPSLAVALRKPAHDASPETLVAVVSDPVYTPDDRRLTVAASNPSRFRGAEELARLPYSAIEARAVTRAFHGARIIELAGFDATARRVIELPSQDLDVLHFATHAVIRKDEPEQSALFLSEYAADGSQLPADRLTTEDITRSGLRADVVVLSGCATGDGRELRGEGVLGLTYGFLANGSNTVIASLWPVEDALTARFMEEFYTAYRVSGHAADALRTAQLRTRNKAGPTVWSSFVVRSNGMP